MKTKIARRLTNHCRQCAVVFFAAFAFSSYTAADQPDNAIVGAGEDFSYVIFDMLKAELEAKSNRRITLFGKNSTLGVGCNAGIKMAKMNAPGRETFGFVCCPLSQEEIDKEGLIVYPLALEPIMILVNESNPVDNLTSQQVRDIFAGKITNWRQVGGNNIDIIVVTRLHCKQRPGNWKTILPDEKAFRADRINLKSAEERAQQIHKFPGAIAHAGTTREFDIDDPIKIVRIDGLLPTAQNLKEKKYPFFRPLSAVTNQKPSPDVLTIIKGVQEGESFANVTKRYQLLPAQLVQ